MEIKTTNEITQKEYDLRGDRSIMDEKEFEEHIIKNNEFNDKKWVAVDDLKKRLLKLTYPIKADDILKELGLLKSIKGD